ncbi:MAG: hypothetical protein LUQ50_12150, partial [Methanospirillum sp.]|uniref:FUSC family protein n=1 Tax=Methanospirillum sp. TaxID=45200 RepID=UPI00236C3F09
SILAGLRPLLKVRNYTLYSMVMTPLVIILLEFGDPISSSVLFDRLIDTMIGVIVAVSLGYLMWLHPSISSLTGDKS